MAGARRSRPMRPDERLASVVDQLHSGTWGGRLRGSRGRGRSAPAGNANLTVGDQAGVVIEHVTAYATASQTIAAGGGAIEFNREAGPPTNRRGFDSFATELAAGAVSDIPIDVTGVLKWRLDSEWASWRSTGTLTATLLRGGSAVGDPRVFDIAGTREWGGDDDDGWEVRANDVMRYELSNDSGSGQTLEWGTLHQLVRTTASPTSDLEPPAGPARLLWRTSTGSFDYVRVHEVDGSLAFEENLDLGGGEGVAWDDGTLWTRGGGNLGAHTWDGSAWALDRQVSLPAGTFGGGMHYDGSDLIILWDRGSDELVWVSTVDGTVDHRLSVTGITEFGGSWADVTRTAAGDLWMQGATAGTVKRINESTGAVAETVNFDDGSMNAQTPGVAATPDGTLLVSATNSASGDMILEIEMDGTELRRATRNGSSTGFAYADGWPA